MSKTSSLTPIEALSTYRADHPIPHETTRFTLQGLSPRASVHRAQALWAVAAFIIVFALVLLEVTDFILLLCLVISAVGSILGAGLIYLVVSRMGGGARTVAVVLTNARLLVAEARANGTTTTRADEDVDVSWVAVDRVNSFWLRDRPVKLLSIGGSQGTIVSVETGDVNDRALDINLAEAGLHRRH